MLVTTLLLLRPPLRRIPSLNPLNLHPVTPHLTHRSTTAPSPPLLQNLKFGKTIRYESRKALAQQRPRLKGQFVKHSQQGSSQGNGTAGDASLGGSGGRSRGLSARYWQNGAQDEQNQNFGLHGELEVAGLPACH
jgi:hypothetical protein